MDLVGALNDYIVEQLHRLPDMYVWDFDLKDFPDNSYRKIGGNSYERSRHLRSYINYNISNNTPQSRALQAWYVSRWGRVKGNKPETLNGYINCSFEELLDLKSKGVASWSKILSIRDPAKFAIYDARVAIALNSIQRKSNVDMPYFFPQLQSQNKKFVQKTQNLIIKSNFFRQGYEPDFYKKYIDLLYRVAHNKNYFDIQDAEMILFATASELSEVWA